MKSRAPNVMGPRNSAPFESEYSTPKDVPVRCSSTMREREREREDCEKRTRQAQSYIETQTTSTHARTQSHTHTHAHRDCIPIKGTQGHSAAGMSDQENPRRPEHGESESCRRVANETGKTRKEKERRTKKRREAQRKEKRIDDEHGQRKAMSAAHSD